MTDRTTVHGLQVATSLFRFVEDKVLPGTGVAPAAFWQGFGTLVHALDGWLRADEAAEGGALALLLDRLHAVGVLPASPGGADRAARLAMMERERTSELADVVLEDPALCFEMLRAVNTAQVRGAQVSGAGPVLTIRRTIAMIGLDGVRRAAFMSLAAMARWMTRKSVHQ